MKSDTTFDITLEEIADPNARLLKVWADYSRWSTLYPESNARVGQALQEFLDDIYGRLSKRPPGACVVLTTLDGVFQCDRTVVDFPVRGSVEWLQTRLDRSGLTGISMTAEIGPASLAAFTRRLVGNWGRAQRGGIVAYEQLWPETYDGLEPIGRRLEASSTVGGAASLENLDLVERLALDTRIQRRLEAFQDAVEFDAGREEPRIAVPILEQIVASLPDGDSGSFDETCRLAEQVLDALRDSFGGSATSALSQLDIERRVEDAGRAIFVRGDTERVAEAEPIAPPEPEPDIPELEPIAGDSDDSDNETAVQGAISVKADAGVRPKRRDDEFDDDLDSFLAEVEHLDALAPEGRTIGIEENPLEALDVYLELVSRRPSAGELPAIRQGMRRLYRTNEAAVLDRIRELTEALRTLGRDNALGRIARFLRDQDLAFLLRLCGAIDVTRTVDEFPRSFGAYLDTVDFDSPEDVLELDDVVRRAGVERVITASDAIGAAVDPELASRILESDSPALRPLVHVLLVASEGKLATPVFAYLRRLRLKDDAACYLWVTEQIEQVPLDYLRDLCRPTARGHYPDTLHERAGELLRRYVREMADDEGQAKRRNYAITSLGGFPGDATRRLLDEIRSAKRFLWMAAESAEARQAAASALKRLRRGGGNV